MSGGRFLASFKEVWNMLQIALYSTFCQQESTDYNYLNCLEGG